MAGPALRLFSPEESPEPVLSLRLAFDRYMRAEVTRTRAKATLAQYQTALRHWEAFVAASCGEPQPDDGIAGTVGWPDTSTVNTTITDNVLAVTDQVLERFRCWLESEQELGAAAIAKTWRFLRPLFNRLGPRVPGNPRGLGILTQVPYMDTSGTPAAGAGTKRILSGDDLNALYKACGQAKWPSSRNVPAPALWRALLVLAYTYGLRTQDLIQLPWSAITWMPDSPDPASTAKHADGWLSFCPGKTARRKATDLVLPLSSVARRHLESIRYERERIFGFPNSPRGLYTQWHALLEGAAVKAADLKDLRKTSNTAYNRLKPGIGSWILGHAPRGVNATFYTSVEQDLLEVIPRLPYPTAMATGATERQRWLWD